VLVEAPMISAALSVAAEVVIEKSAYDIEVTRIGNRSNQVAPQGIYPTSEPDPVGLGDRRWVALSVVNDGAWRALCDVLQRPEWSDWTQSTRRARHDEIDGAITAWTSASTVDDVAETLLPLDIPVGEVVLGHLVPNLEQVTHRGFFERVEHPKTGLNTHATVAVRWSSWDGPVLAGPAPMLGEHDEQIWKGVVGVGDEEYSSLLDAGVIGQSINKALAW
jgi:crotonobetainyl-CoA:carnitine CoA-transferase CaiB-like acyl-CoA transferase